MVLEKVMELSQDRGAVELAWPWRESRGLARGTDWSAGGMVDTRQAGHTLEHGPWGLGCLYTG